MIEWLLRRRLVRFTAVGGAATLLQFSLLALFVEQLSISAVPASAAAFAISAGCNYWLNYRFTFASRDRHRRTLPKFVLVALIGLAINTASFTLLLFTFHYLAAQCLATLITLASNFALHQYWIYREEP